MRGITPAINFRKDLEVLLACGPVLDWRPRGGPRTLRDVLIAALLRIRARDGSLIPLRANRVQQQFSRTSSRRNIVLKARQMGVSTWVAARFFVHVITNPGSLAVVVAHHAAGAEQLFKIVHRFWANLPRRLREGALVTSRANVRQIVFPLLDSEYRVETAADPDAGRGLTIHCLHASEVARWPRDPEATLASLRAALTPGGEEVLESTPEGAAGIFYREWQQAAESGVARHFYPWWWEAAYVALTQGFRTPSEEELELVRAHQLTPGQLAFRRKLLRDFGRYAPQEFAEDAEQCFLASTDCIFDLATIDARLAAIAAENMPLEGDHVTIFCPPLPRRRYIIGVDTASGGAHGDYSCAQVIDRHSGVQCAELHGRIPPPELAARLVRLAAQYNDALIAVETNQHGHAVLALLEQFHHWPTLYCGRSGAPGFVTDAASRPAMLVMLGCVFSAQPELFASARLLREMRTFVRDAAGRSAAAPGCHDDTVVAMAIALEVRSLVAGK